MLILDILKTATTEDEQKQKNKRRKIVKELKILAAAHYDVHVSKDKKEIANAINVSEMTLKKYKRCPEWGEAKAFWNGAVHKPSGKNDRPKEKGDSENKESLRQLKQSLFETQNGICNGCGFKLSIYHLSIDHIHAKSKGGTNSVENLQLLCHPCNSIKEDGTHEELIRKLQAIGIRKHQRFQYWLARALYAGFFFLLSVIYLY